jgi:translation initiation factor 2D
MFKKAAQCEAKNEGKLRGKELKKLRADAQKAFPPLSPPSSGDDESAALLLDALLPLKGKEASLRKLGGGSRTQLFCIDGIPMLVDTGEKRGATLFPTLAGLWAAPGTLPIVWVHPPVSKYLIGGADLMLPGLHSIEGSAQPTDYVALCIAGNPAAVAVGRLLQTPGHAAAGQDGRLVESLHYYGDALWQASGQQVPRL